MKIYSYAIWFEQHTDCFWEDNEKRIKGASIILTPKNTKEEVLAG